jgi:hypothetical protein
MNDKNQTVIHWSEVNFSEMSWHDCLIHGLEFDQDGDYQNDLIFDLDYIIEWIEDGKGSFRFSVAPVLLRFQNVDRLHIQTLLHFKEAFQIHSIDRITKKDKGFENHHWIIKIQTYMENISNQIEFDATGFVQELSAPPITIETQNLTRQQREKMKKENNV